MDIQSCKSFFNFSYKTWVAKIINIEFFGKETQILPNQKKIEQTMTENQKYFWAEKML